MRTYRGWIAITTLLLAGTAGCGDNGSAGSEGPEGPEGPGGPTGPEGPEGPEGPGGPAGPEGPGGVGGACPAGMLGDGDIEGVPSSAPLSGMVALSFCDAAGTGAANVADYVKELVDRYATHQLDPDMQFPLRPASTDQVRAIAGLVPDVVVRWLDPLTWSADPAEPRFGSHGDFMGYFGDGWQADGSPIYAGSDTEAWVWVNHEYVSNSKPGITAPTGQHRTLARYLAYWGLIDPMLATTGNWDAGSISIYIHEWKRQIGGSWIHIVQDPATGEWQLDRSVDGVRYDATDSTLTKVTGQDVSVDHDDDGVALPADVAVGLIGDCSGTVTPWGTVITAEENVDVGYGDLEPVWSSDQKFTATATNFPNFLPGANITFSTNASATSDYGPNADLDTVHPRDLYGYLAEIDPGVDPAEYFGKTTAGVGHQKLGSMGRARWENAAIAVGADWNLVAGQRVVIYGGQDRRGGHIYKWVSAAPYTAGMTRAQVRDLLDDGTLYVAHFAGLNNASGINQVGTNQPASVALPGSGRWVELSLDSTAVAPNGATLGTPTKTVGQALADVSWNRMGGFASDDDVRRALFTASLKIGARELNRPEDIEYNPADPSGHPRLYVAFTNHNRKVALDQSGALYDPAVHATASPTRTDRTGSIFAIDEADPANPGASQTFSYFMVWRGSEGDGEFDAACPDNILIDADGGVWFGTDGNFGVNGHADAVYYLDLDPAHTTTASRTYGKAFRVAAAPSDAETTGPMFSSEMGTLFFNVQHPGEEQLSSWPPR